ncbi:uncharacterized protein LOC131284071 [Anopheles ziemanni]|uniref:uncharacterized protein LOC131260819 n=1 Tax=Anopheles coustani TaxID=139045 RepID=UPI0026591AA7|nr:uncharacterized protein LOC131260819 [Anopheles coustani]XP_058168909.1 uncharacterized protein LOC131284071 [Anopheles ziemanni]
MEAAINRNVFKLFGLMPIVAPSGGALWKTLLNIAYSLCLILFLLAQQVMIYQIHLERDFAGLFISTIMLLTSIVILVQALLSAKGLQVLLGELAEIEHATQSSRLAAGTAGRTRYSVMFYITYLVGVSRGIYRTVLMVYLDMRKVWIALQLLVPSLIILARINQQIHLMELFAGQLERLVDELALLFDDDYGHDGQLISADAVTRYRVGKTIQRMEHIFGRLQKCLILFNDLFGWSTAALVVFAFVNITFQFRSPMKPLPVHAQLVDIFYTIMWLLFLCHASSDTTTKVNETRRLLLKPFYHASLWEQIHNFIVRIQLQPFEFTANGLYSINYGLFSSTLAASATYIVIMFQFDQKVLEV